MAKRSAEGVGCITIHPGFQGVYLNPWVLQAAYIILTANTMEKVPLKDH